MLIKSHFLKPNGNRSMNLLENHYLEIDCDGKICFFGNSTEGIVDFPNRFVLDMTDKVIIPGLIDLHTHIPQYPALGTGQGTVLEWLDRYIFPLEARFNDPEYAFYLSDVFFNDCIKLGTSTVVAYSSSSYAGTDSAFKAAKESGIRAFIGMSMMDLDSPKSLIHSTEDSILDAKKLMSKWHDTDSGRLSYIFTPRYALTCSEDMMKKIAEIAVSEDVFIQTHLAENKEEVRRVFDKFPNHNSYTDVYNNCGLLTDKTLLAHCIYLSDYELNLIKDKGSKIVHCASSNRFLKSGIFPFYHIRKFIPTGLGTDVAGGTSLSMLSEIKEVLETVKTHVITYNEYDENLCPTEALWYATKGNAQILGIDNETGDFEPGLFADFAAFSTDRLNILNESINCETVSCKIIYLLGNSNTDEMYIRGKRLYSSSNC